MNNDVGGLINNEKNYSYLNVLQLKLNSNECGQQLPSAVGVGHLVWHTPFHAGDGCLIAVVGGLSTGLWKDICTP